MEERPHKLVSSRVFNFCSANEVFERLRIERLKVEARRQRHLRHS